MKKQIILLGLLTAMTAISFAQTPSWLYSPSNYIYNSSGNVGLGLTSAPFDRLHIEGGLRVQKNGSDGISPQLYIGNATASNNRGFNFQLNASGDGLALWGYNYGAFTWNQNFVFTKDANFGVNTAAPQAYLHVSTRNDNGTGLFVEQKYTSANAVGLLVKTWNDYSTAFQIQLNGATTSHVFKVQGNGKTIIGGTIPSNHTDAYLAVGGKIVCRDLYVTVTNWADYVFEKEYKLPDLKEVKEYYQVNKHLPGVPTACEIEEKGINVAEISTIQMQKIEELTIYMVQMKEELEQLKKENEVLKTLLKK